LIPVDRLEKPYILVQVPKKYKLDNKFLFLY